MFTKSNNHITLEWQAEQPQRYPFWCTKCKVVAHLTAKQAVTAGAATLYDIDNLELLDI